MIQTSLVVEFGAGTGQFSVEAAPACARLIAVDVSPLMLSRLRDEITALGLDKVELVRAGFLSYEHSGSPADFIYSPVRLHHLRDFWKAVALARLRRMIRPGGVLRLWDVVYDFAPRRRRSGSRRGAPRAAVSRGSGAGRSWRTTSATSTPSSAGSSNR